MLDMGASISPIECGRLLHYGHEATFWDIITKITVDNDMPCDDWFEQCVSNCKYHIFASIIETLQYSDMEIIIEIIKHYGMTAIQYIKAIITIQENIQRRNCIITPMAAVYVIHKSGRLDESIWFWGQFSQSERESMYEWWSNFMTGNINVYQLCNMTMIEHPNVRRRLDFYNVESGDETEILGDSDIEYE
jgi:hypothetical protein